MECAGQIVLTHRDEIVANDPRFLFQLSLGSGFRRFAFLYPSADQALLAEGVVPSALLISRVVPLTAVRAAFDDLERGLAMKILVQVGGTRDAE
jgi:threonine dehydrogenase-like Zn-dependent dehydrogenase